MTERQLFRISVDEGFLKTVLIVSEESHNTRCDEKKFEVYEYIYNKRSSPSLNVSP